MHTIVSKENTRIAVILIFLLCLSSTELFAQLTGSIHNPVMAPSNPDLIAYELNDNDGRSLYLYNHATGQTQEIAANATNPATESLLGSADVEGQYEGRLTWSNKRDNLGRLWFVFVSSQRSGYELRLGFIDAENQVSGSYFALPFSGDVDLPAWSPDGQKLVFCAVPRGGVGFQLYLVSNMNEIPSAALSGDIDRVFRPEALTNNPEGNLFPAWSPSSMNIAYQARLQSQETGVLNWGINVINLSNRTDIRITSEGLDSFDEYKPSWSPDGRHIAYYVSEAEKGGPTGGSQQNIGISLLSASNGNVQLGMIVRGQSIEAGRNDRVQNGVFAAESRGPAVIDEGNDNISVVYVKLERGRDPIQKAEISIWKDQSETERPYVDVTETNNWGTSLHQELAVFQCEDTGGLRYAFVSQEGGRLGFQVRDEGNISPCIERPFQAVSFVDSLIPGVPDIKRGKTLRGATIIGVTVGAVVVAAVSHSSWSNGIDDFATRLQEEVLIAAQTNKSNEQAFNDALKSKPSESVRTVAIIGYGVVAAIVVTNLIVNRKSKRANNASNFGMMSSPYLYENGAFSISKPELGIQSFGENPEYQVTIKVKF